MGQSPAAPVPNPFRSADAAIYRAPDRTEWERKYGTIPRELTGVDPKFLSRARAAVERDRTGLMQAEAVAAQESLGNVCTAIEYAFNLKEQEFAFFDSDTDSFWVYEVKRP